MPDRPGKPGPKYRHIAADLRGQIASGALPVDGKLPTKNTLAEHYGVALATVDRALDDLRHEGLIRSDQGAGTYILKMPDEPSSEFVIVMKRLDEMEDDVRQLRETVERLRAGQDPAPGH